PIYLKHPSSPSAYGTRRLSVISPVHFLLFYGDSSHKSSSGGNVIFGIFSAEMVIKYTTGLWYTYCKKIITGGILWVQTSL
ncbi:hypothetical protein, partial [Enterocloster hominis (ex Hitch et al. 2024)]